MSVYQVPDPEELLVCPYDNVHMIRAKRFQYHLIKCRQNHLSKEFATCPFNAKHEMPKPELRYHMANCPFRAVVEREIEYDEDRRNGMRVMLKGCTDVPAYNTVNPSNEENWDAEIPLHTRMGVDPSFFESLQYRNTSGMSRSARKEFYQKLRNKELGIVETEAVETVSTLRIPSQKSKAAMMQPKNAAKPHSLDVFTYSLSMAGIGRGRGFLQDPPEAAQGRPGKPPTKNSMEPFSGVRSELM